jgi:hypothetical protein
MDTKEFLTLAIPGEIRLMEHPDGKLLIDVLVTALGAYHDSGSVWDKKVAADIHAALMVCLKNTIEPHLLKEDEDWSALKAKAEAAPVAPVETPEATRGNSVAITKLRRMPDSAKRPPTWKFEFSGSKAGKGELIAYNVTFGGAKDTMFAVNLYDESGDILSDSEKRSSSLALKKAFDKIGLKVSNAPLINPSTLDVIERNSGEIDTSTLSHPSSEVVNVSDERINRELDREPV